MRGEERRRERGESRERAEREERAGERKEGATTRAV